MMLRFLLPVIAVAVLTTGLTAWTGWGAAAPSAKLGSFLPYDCGTPAALTTLLCDKLPPGYVIFPRLSNSPAPTRPSNMSDSAWLLLEKTFGNGVCDPNETWITDPLDCAAPEIAIQDPYTGRPGVPATVCQPPPERIPGQSGG